MSSAGSSGECRYGTATDACEQFRLRLHNALDDFVGDGEDDERGRRPVASSSAEELDADGLGTHAGCIHFEDLDQRFVDVRPLTCRISSIQAERTGCDREGRSFPDWEACV